jgi:hypothetical protein
VQDVHPRSLGGEGVGEVAGAVGRAVVDDEQLEARGGEALDEVGERLGFVVGGDHDDGARGVGRRRARRSSGAGCRGRRLASASATSDDRRVDARTDEAGHGGDRAGDDRGELLVAGHGEDLGRGGADAIASGHAVDEADRAAGLVAQQEGPRPDAHELARRTAGADATQAEGEGQGLQQRRDGEERDRERELPAVERPVEGGKGVLLRPGGEGEAEDGGGGEQGAGSAACGGGRRGEERAGSAECGRREQRASSAYEEWAHGACTPSLTDG